MKKGIRSIKRGLAVLLSACMVFGMKPIQAGAEEAGTTLKQAGLTLPKYWEDRMVKAVRKVLLFDVERKKTVCMDGQRAYMASDIKGHYSERLLSVSRNAADVGQ